MRRNADEGLLLHFPPIVPFFERLVEKEWFGKLQNPCSRDPFNYTTTFINRTTSEVLNLEGRQEVLRIMARVQLAELRQIHDYMVSFVPAFEFPLTFPSLQENPECQWDMLPYLNPMEDLQRLARDDAPGTMNLERMKLLYKSFMLLAATYRYMAEDWKYGSICSTWADSYIMTEFFYK